MNLSETPPLSKRKPRIMLTQREGGSYGSSAFLRARLWFRRHRPLLLLTTILLTITFIIGIIFAAFKPYINLALAYGISPSFVYSLIDSRHYNLRQNDARTNILLLGIPGGNYEGKDLTDSMLIMSISSQSSSPSVFITLPRDIWSPTIKDKINSAYHYGEEKRKGGGLVLVKSTVNEVTGLPIHYAVVLDFARFVGLIDILGGVDVKIEQAFEDDDFPVSGRENDLCNADPEFRCRYKKIRFEKGIEHMDGERALEFARSRHASDDEGTDYARSQRQQALLFAIKEKLFSKKVLLNVNHMRRLIGVFEQATDTDLLISDFITIANILRQQDIALFRRISIPAEGRVRKDSDLLIAPRPGEYAGRWVLVPRKQDFAEIHEFIRCQLESGNCSTLKF